MRDNIYPEIFLNKVVYHKKEKTYYYIKHLPKKYTDKSKTHAGDYFLSVIRMNNNEDKVGSTTRLHITPRNKKKCVIMKHSKNLIATSVDENKFTEDVELTKDFYEYIDDIHYGHEKFTSTLKEMKKK